MVERVPRCVLTSNGFALTMLMILHYWFIEKRVKVDLPIKKSRNAIVLTYDFLIYSEVIRRDCTPLPPPIKKSAAGSIQPFFLK